MDSIEQILDILFNIFIYPIEYIMKSIIDNLFDITNNYVVSIILLSIIINIILLPLYYLSEKLKNDNQKILDKLQPEIDDLKRNFNKQTLHFYIQALYKTNNYHPINNIKASLGLLLQIPFFIAAFHFIGNYEVFNQVSFGFIGDLGKPDGLLNGINILPFLMTIISLLSVYMYSSNMSKSEKYQLIGLSFIFLIFLYFESSALLIYWTMNNLFSLVKSQFEKYFDLDWLKNKTAFLFINLFTATSNKIQQNKTLNFIIKDIYVQAIILFFGTIFIYKAIPLAASDTGMYLASYPLVVLSLVGFFLISIFVAYFIYYLLPHKLKYIVTVLAVFGALSGLYYGFINPLELEQMRILEMPRFFFVNDIYDQKDKIFIIVLSFLSLISIFFIFKKMKNTFLIILLVSNAILLLQSFSLGINPKEISTMDGKSGSFFNYSKKLETKLHKAYSFSKKSNVIIILMDNFQSDMFNEAIIKYPNLKQQLSGFIYYPNTLSYGKKTWANIGPMVGGAKYRFHEQWNRKHYNKLPSHQHDDAYLANMLMAKKYNYSYATYGLDYMHCNIFDSYKNDTICLKHNDTKKEISKKSKNNIAHQLSKGSSGVLYTAITFSKITSALSVPHILKTRLANRGIETEDINILEAYLNHTNNYSQLRNMSDFANLDSHKNTFKVIHNKLTHVEWMINSQCKIVNKTFRNYDGFLDVTRCTIELLTSFLNKLKKLGIYDKTKIIIVADHGDSGTYIPKNKAKAFNPLMLVKDFNSRDKFSTSNQFLSNVDTYGIALSGISNGSETVLDPIKNPQKNRTLIHVAKFHKWKLFTVTQAFKVKNNIFDKKNWEKLNEKQIKKLDKY